jgi:RNA polymerase sigma-70 factor (ECF subfamily)
MEYLAALNKKELKAWEDFYKDYYASLCSYAYRFVKDADCSEDIIQDTLISIWRSTLSFHSERELANYLYKSVYINSMQHLRTQNLHNAHLLRLQKEVEVDDEESLALSVREELIRQMQAVIRELPEQRRKIMQLSLEGLSGKEIAEQLGITIHTVKTQKSKAFVYLRKKMGSLSLLLFISCLSLKNL